MQAGEAELGVGFVEALPSTNASPPALSPLATRLHGASKKAAYIVSSAPKAPSL